MTRMTPGQLWNFAVLVVHFTALRVGWIFKLETMVMPLFLDALGAGPSVQGLLPVLGRIGNSVPQYVLSGRLEAAAVLKGTLAILTFLMAVPWLLLGALAWLFPSWPAAVWIPLFLGLYFWSWSANGMSLLVQGMLQGKLVPPDQRGRLLAVWQAISAVLGILALLFILPQRFWTNEGPRGFSFSFLATGSLFLVSGLSILFLSESKRLRPGPIEGLGGLVAGSLRLLGVDPSFRRFLGVVGLMHMILLLMPHFVTFGKRTVGAQDSDIIYWVIGQTVGTGLGSLLFGSLADRRGNRIALVLLVGWLAAIPMAAVVIGQLAPTSGRTLYGVVFLMLGCAPVSQRVLTNYVLELAPMEEHARYLGTLNLWQMFPPLFAPLVGWLIEETSYAVVLAGGAAVLLAGTWQAATLIEPRALPTGGAAGLADSLGTPVAE